MNEVQNTTTPAKREENKFEEKKGLSVEATKLHKELRFEECWGDVLQKYHVV